MGRVLYEAVPATTELDLRLRRLESRIAKLEALLRERADPPRPPRPIAEPD